MAKKDDIRAFKDRALQAAHERGELFLFEKIVGDVRLIVGHTHGAEEGDEVSVVVMTDPESLKGLALSIGTARQLAFDLIQMAVEAEECATLPPGESC